MNKVPLSKNYPLYQTSNASLLRYDGHLLEDVDLDDLIKSELQTYISQTEKSSFILRLDKLPVVYGEKLKLTWLFQELISMILNHPPGNSKLFLYLQCTNEKVDPEVLDLSTQKTGSYSFCFFTNIHTDEHWKQLSEIRLGECKIVASRCKGHLSQNDIDNTGCLFSLTLPGKTN